MCVIRVAKKEEKGRQKNTLIKAEMFPNLMKTINSQKKFNKPQADKLEEIIHKHIKTKLLKTDVKENIFKAATSITF